jgi:hypothetical protein
MKRSDTTIVAFLFALTHDSKCCNDGNTIVGVQDVENATERWLKHDIMIVKRYDAVVRWGNIMSS